MPAITVASERVNSETSLLKYRIEAARTPSVFWPRLIVFR